LSVEGAGFDSLDESVTAELGEFVHSVRWMDAE